VGFLGAPQGDNSNFELNVYSRWGENIFSSTSVDETWDGRINGKLVPAGVYAVHVRYLDGAGGWHQQRVALTVLPGE
jgi:gliding motility-associated-like protein